MPPRAGADVPEKKLPAGLHRETIAVRSAVDKSQYGENSEHGRLTEQHRQAAGIRQNLLRLAAGLEHPGDLKADLSRGLDTL
jgi:O-acetylhomoserine/O-acetylserine sulfhydrylase-like pyridoxal-dependent enzyme